MVLTVVAILLAMTGAGASLNESVLAWGGGMWSLLELAMQFAIAMVAAHACVSSRPVFRLLDRLASLPNPQRPLFADNRLRELGTQRRGIRFVRAIRR